MDKAVILPEKKQYQEIGEDLRAQIIQGHYPVGSRLPPERNIAETYGVSRTIVREALLMLELQGTVDIRQGSGVYVMRIPEEHENEEERFPAPHHRAGATGYCRRRSQPGQQQNVPPGAGGSHTKPDAAGDR